MKFTLIKGHYYVVGYSPDGDSIKFKANNPQLWNTFETDNRKALDENLAEDNGIVTLRLQGIDAFETHYSPENPTPPKGVKFEPRPTIKKPDAGEHKQPHRIALEATNAFLRLLGVEGATWKSWGKNSWVNRINLKRDGSTVEIRDKYADAIHGYIVTNDVETNGRPIAWVFAGTTQAADGLTLTTETLLNGVEQSANYQLLKQGLVYPYFFMTLPARLRQKLSEAAQTAQRAAAAQLEKIGGQPVPETQSNLWLFDRTINGIEIDDLKHITEDFGLYPYLFRRIVKHWYANQMQRYWDALLTATDTPAQYDRRIDLVQFFEDGNPYIFVISDQDFVRLNEILLIEGRKLTLTKYPFDLVFLS
jgi:endonuclease YncB( thermonuclease family)